jgi:anhydro-N-acetylmuramic acid kinase
VKVLGLISGTSHDGIDACVVEFEVTGETLQARIIGSGSTQYSKSLRATIVAALPPEVTSFEDVCNLDTAIGQEFGQVAASMVSSFGAVDLVSSHGQTMYHWIAEHKALGTLQLGQPAWIAAAASSAVISDLRIQDIVSGGQGAPLVPVLDLLALGGKKGKIASLNLGGIANITVIENGELITAFDTGPASALIDAVVLKHDLNAKGYDDRGAIAASGSVNQALLDRLLADPYYSEPAPKSTGKELFHIRYLDRVIEELSIDISPVDLVATVTELTAVTVANALMDYKVTSLFAAGGGLRNHTLMNSIKEKTGLSATSFSDIGIDSDFKEAFAMALIGYLSAHNLAVTFPVTTGAKKPPVLGRITPGPDGYFLPKPLSSLPKSLVVTSD